MRSVHYSYEKRQLELEMEFGVEGSNLPCIVWDEEQNYNVFEGTYGECVDALRYLVRHGVSLQPIHIIGLETGRTLSWVL